MSSLIANMIIVDNSEWMRNADFGPSRFQAQMDVVSMIASGVTGKSPENAVGFISASGAKVECALVTDAELSKLLTSITKLEIRGKSSLQRSFVVAQLALKQRFNKKQAQKILAFVGSPVTETAEELEQLGLRLKKNSVAVDLVSFGEADANLSKLQTFIAAVNNNGNSNLISFGGPNGPLSEMLANTPVFKDFLGAEMDPNMDPELAYVLSLSLQESGQPVPANLGGANANNDGDLMDIDDPELRAALELSMQEGGGQMEVDQPVDDEDEELKLAKEMSMQTDEEVQPEPSPSIENVEDILATLPGVDMNDPNLKGLLDAMKKEKEDKK